VAKVLALLQSGQAEVAVSLCDVAFFFVSSAARSFLVDLWGPSMLEMMECLQRHGLYEAVLRLHQKCAIVSRHSPDGWRRHLLGWTVCHADGLVNKIPPNLATAPQTDRPSLTSYSGHIPEVAVELLRQLRILSPNECNDDIKILRSFSFVQSGHGDGLGDGELAKESTISGMISALEQRKEFLARAQLPVSGQSKLSPSLDTLAQQRRDTRISVNDFEVIRVLGKGRVSKVHYTHCCDRTLQTDPFVQLGEGSTCSASCMEFIIRAESHVQAPCGCPATASGYTHGKGCARAHVI